ncbi:MAG: RNA polymerase sigma factor [Actinomycetes bacterium]
MGEPQTYGSHQAQPEEVLSDALIQARKGEEAGFAVLWRHHNSRLTRFVQSRTYGSSIDADEVVSETWLNVAKDIRKFDGGPSEFSAWLYSISRNRIIDAVRIRDRQVRPTEELEEAFWIPSPLNVEKEFDASEEVRRIIRAINSLPAAQAEVLALRIVSDLSVAETAKVVKKSANSVRVLAHRGLTALRAELAGESNNE